MTHADLPIRRATFAVDELFAAHPPRWVHRNKKALYEHLCPPGTRHSGELTVSRWAVRPLPLGARGADATTQIELRPDVFTYDQPAASASEWHLNFAHSSLFIAYGGPLFAQDEMQVAEHPVLACVRERLAARPDPRARGRNPGAHPRRPTARSRRHCPERARGPPVRPLR